MTSIRFLASKAPRAVSRFAYTPQRQLAFPPQHQPTPKQSTFIPRRAYSTPAAVEAPDYLDERERDIFSKLQATFQPVKLEVQDVSGGCGSMYAVEISSDKFKGLTLLKQHRLVKDALGEDVKKWHGFQLRTKVPE